MLRRFDTGRRRARPEHHYPFLAHGVSQPGSQRSFRAYHGQAALSLPRQPNQPGHVSRPDRRARGEPADSGVTGGSYDPSYPGALREAPGYCVLPSARPYHQHIGSRRRIGRPHMYASSVSEMPSACEDHGHAMRVRRLDRVLVSQGSARLDYGCHACLRRNLDGIGEREECV